MKPKIIITTLVLFAVLIVSGGKAYARSIESEKSGSLLEKRYTTKFMLKNGLSLWEDRSPSDQSNLLSETNHESESGDDRSTDLKDDDSSSDDNSSSTLFGTVPTISMDQSYIADDKSSSSFESETKSGSSKSDDSSTSHESHSGHSGESYDDHSGEINDR